MSQRAGTLSGGEQQMLALGRALMSRPKLLLLDEPSLGLAPMIVREFFRIVRELNEKEGLTVLVVEQDARIALRASSRAYVLEVGRVALTGTSDELSGDESDPEELPRLLVSPQASSVSLAAAKRRHASSSVAPISADMGAPCVLAWLAFRSPCTRRRRD